MSRITREMRSGITSQSGISKMKTIKATLMILVLTLFSTAWGQSLPFITHSVGIGPAFEVFPSIAVPDKNGEVNLTFFSSQTNVLYSVLLKNGGMKKTKDGFLRLSYHLNGLYSYLTIVAATKSDPWDTSVATVVVLSPKISFDENAPLTFFVTPSSTYSGKAVKMKLYAILGPKFGKKEISFYRDDEKIFDEVLSPFVDSPKVVEYTFDEKVEKLENGYNTFKAQLELVSGEKITVKKTVNVITSSTPTIHDLKVFPNVTGTQMKVKVKFKVDSSVLMKNVWVNGIKGIQNGEEWQATLTYSNLHLNENPTLVLNVKMENVLGKTFNSTIFKPICLNVPKVDFVELINRNGAKIVCRSGETTIVREESLPISFKIVPHVVTKCGTPQVKILVDGKANTEITIDRYDVTHKIEVIAVNSMNPASSTSVPCSIIVKRPFPLLPFSWWAVIGILSAMIISLFLTLY